MQSTENDLKEVSFLDALSALFRNWRVLFFGSFAGAVVASIAAGLIIPAYMGGVDIKMAVAIYPYSDSPSTELRLVRQEVESAQSLKIKLGNALRSNPKLQELCGYKSIEGLSILFEPVSIVATNKYSMLSITNRQDSDKNIMACLSEIYALARQDQHRLIESLQAPLKETAQKLRADLEDSGNSLRNKLSGAKRSDELVEAYISMGAFDKKIARLNEIQLALDSSLDAQMLGDVYVSAHLAGVDKLAWLVLGGVSGFLLGMLKIFLKR